MFCNINWIVSCFFHDPTKSHPIHLPCPWLGVIGMLGVLLFVKHLPGLKELFTLPALLSHHAAWPGLPQSPLAALCFDIVGIVGLATCAMMNLVNLSSFEFILLCTSCRMDTCSISYVIVDICESTCLCIHRVNHFTGVPLGLRCGSLLWLASLNSAYCHFHCQ